jgi:L-ribulose-5-phosphate 4-epimerase
MPTDGVIQYQQHWEQGPPVNSSLVTPLEQWRERLYGVGLIGAYPDGLGYGNLSIRHGGGFIITGTQTGHLPSLDHSHYTFVSKVDIPANQLWCKGPVKASSEGMTHAACYALDSSIQAVFHVHNLDMWKAFMDVWPTTDAKITYGTPAMALAVEEVWKQHGKPLPYSLVMAGHEEGIIVAGRSMDEVGELLLESHRLVGA